MTVLYSINEFDSDIHGNPSVPDDRRSSTAGQINDKIQILIPLLLSMHQIKNIITDPLSRMMTDSSIVKRAMLELVPIFDEIQ
jgi:hypothetical protein